jgi:hypothetical protein
VLQAASATEKRLFGLFCCFKFREIDRKVFFLAKQRQQQPLRWVVSPKNFPKTFRASISAKKRAFGKTFQSRTLICRDAVAFKPLICCPGTNVSKYFSRKIWRN